jgi:hypothetical protein
MKDYIGNDFERYINMPFFFIMILSIFSSLCFAAGSGKVTPPEVKAQYPTHVTQTATIENEQYTRFDPCPPHPICDVKSPSDRDCPAQCIVNRIVNPLYGTGKDPQYSYVIDVKNAVCPPGYAQVASFKLERQIIHDPSRGPLFPVQYHQKAELERLGWTPDIWGNVQRNEQCVYDITNSPYQLNVVVNINGQAGMYKHTVAGNCYTGLSGCADIWKTSCGTLGAMRKWYGDYYLVRYSPPYNQLYYDPEKVIPTSIVCAHVRPGWQEVPKTR